MSKQIVSWAMAVVVAVATGCSGQPTPTQPTLSDDQIKDAMKKGRDQTVKERGKYGPGGSPVR